MNFDLRIRRLEEKTGFRPETPETKKTEEQLLAELEEIWNETAAEIPGWVARLRSGKVTVHVSKADWSPVWQWNFNEGGAACLMSLSGALYEYFEGRRNPEGREGAPHAPAGVKEPTTAEECADLLEKYAEDICGLITLNRWRGRTGRTAQGFKPEADWWKD